MPFKIKFLKFISLTLFTVLFNQTINAQKVKIDAVGVVVGKNIVLDSDIEKFKLELENSSEGKIKISDCEMLEQLMLQKLLAHHAVVDSIIVSDAEVNDTSITRFDWRGKPFFSTPISDVVPPISMTMASERPVNAQAPLIELVGPEANVSAG